ncbi:hypothetical protein Syun_030797 [Stephania yunnanensis]|uniref:Uncharacterized protein n=1 Tax=Stephania yunnanensis TaxID=152371 RepID=A0AAP0E2G0_9MAGN
MGSSMRILQGVYQLSQVAQLVHTLKNSHTDPYGCGFEERGGNYEEILLIRSLWRWWRWLHGSDTPDTQIAGDRVRRVSRRKPSPPSPRYSYE